MFWDSVCPSSTGNTLSSTNWLSPLLGGHCCLCSSIQKFKKVVDILCSPRQRPGSQGIIFRVRLLWRHKAYMKGWKQVTIPFLLSDGFQSFIKLLHTKERKKKKKLSNSANFLHKTSHGNSKATFILIIWTPTLL